MLRAAAIALPRALLAGACYGGSLLARIAGKACSAYALLWHALAGTNARHFSTAANPDRVNDRCGSGRGKAEVEGFLGSFTPDSDHKRRAHRGRQSRAQKWTHLALRIVASSAFRTSNSPHFSRANDPTTSRIRRMNSSAMGLIVRFFSVTIPMRLDCGASLTGRILIESRLAASWMRELE